MNFKLDKLKSFSFNFSKLRGAFRLSPKDLWRKFLWILIFLTIAIIVFNGWIFYRFYFGNENNINANDGGLKTKNMENALKRIDLKVQKFSEYQSTSIEDPSIIK